jgi:hypothetical protein
VLKKTSIYLEQDLDERLARRAAEEGITKAELIRRTLAAAVQPPRRPKPSVGVFDSGKGDLSANVGEHLRTAGFGAT